MREDMFKVIVERPRGGKNWVTSSRTKLTGDGDLPVKIGVRRHVAITQARRKWLSENLAPLRRWLGKQVGRTWNDVHAEIVGILTSRDPVQQHILQHVDGYVARVVVCRDGTLMNGRRPRSWLGSSGLPWRQRWYVDPTDGVLKESEVLWRRMGLDPKPWKWREKLDPDIRKLDKTRELRRIDGLWYEVQFHHDRRAAGWVYDHLTRANVLAGERHAIAKRQLSRAELKAHGLANAPLN